LEDLLEALISEAEKLPSNKQNEKWRHPRQYFITGRIRDIRNSLFTGHKTRVSPAEKQVIYLVIYKAEMFCVLPHSVRINSGVIPQIKLQSLPSASFTIHCLLSSIDATYCEVFGVCIPFRHVFLSPTCHVSGVP
jgi:hypothetical protein